MTVSFLVQKKGAVDDYVIRRLLQFFPGVGLPREYGRGPFRSGVAHAGCGGEAGQRERGEAQTILEHSPVRSSGSNGVVERAIKEVEYQCAP